jgi:imidazolonepropionase-like amidohydrolase
LSNRELVLLDGLLIDGSGKPPLEDAAVVIHHGLITWVGDVAKLEVPENATVVELNGASMLPGFINAHVHNGFNSDNLRAWAWEGVTTVRDMGARYHSRLFGTRDALNSDNRNARLVAAGPLVTVPGGYPTVPWGALSAFPVSSPEDAASETERLLDSGADFIKIALERGDVFGTTIPVLSAEMTSEIARVTHGAGTLVSAHITAARDLELVLDGGADDIAHMAATRVSDELITQLVDADIYWVPTLELWHGVGGPSAATAHDNLRRFVDAGGKVALGTDFDGYSTPFDLGMPIRELTWMLDAGMSPMETIVAATSNAAHVCNLAGQLGVIEVGTIADVLVVAGNPLDDLETALRDVLVVIHNGVVLRDER